MAGGDPGSGSELKENAMGSEEQRLKAREAELVAIQKTRRLTPSETDELSRIRRRLNELDHSPGY